MVRHLSLLLFMLLVFFGCSSTGFAQYGSGGQFSGGSGFGGYGGGGFGGGAFSGGFSGGGIYGGAQNVTPYINLLTGKSAAVNYLSGVAPLTQSTGIGSGSSFQDINAIRRFNLEGPDDSIPQLPETGHPVRFLTYYPYYNLGTNVRRSNLLYPFRPQPNLK